MSLNIPFKYSNARKINLGLTNDNYLIDIDKVNYIVRIPKSDTKDLFNRSNEQLVLNLLKDKDFVINPIYYKDGIQVVAYDENLENFDEYNEVDKIKKVANLMNKLHSLEIKVKHHFNPLEMIDKYMKYTKNIEIKLDDYKSLFDKLKKHEFEPTLCHNDWVSGNICFKDDNTYLIDYEYSGLNDRYFDIMSFITENDLSDDQIKEFLSYIFPKGISEEEQDILMMYRDINNILWYLWANMMYTLRGEEIYLTISKIKLAQIKTEYNQKLKNLP